MARRYQSTDSHVRDHCGRALSVCMSWIRRTYSNLISTRVVQMGGYLQDTIRDYFRLDFIRCNVTQTCCYTLRNKLRDRRNL